MLAMPVVGVLVLSVSVVRAVPDGRALVVLVLCRRHRR
jgi:hypothetical protein